MGNDCFWNYFLYKDSIRVLEKNNVKLDEMDSKQKNELIEMVMEDLDDKYRDMP